MSKLYGYRTLIFCWLVVAHGLGQILGVFHPSVGGTAFDSGQDSLQMAFANAEIIFGLIGVFLRLGQKASEKRIIAAIKGDSNE